MALINCYDCGKEISSLATACPSCGAPPRDAVVPPPPPPPAQSSRAKQLSRGTIALLTGVVLLMVIRGVTYRPDSPSSGTSPTSETANATTTSPPPVETASQSPSRFVAAEMPAAEANTKSSPPNEPVSRSSSSLAAAETPAAEATSTSSPSVEEGLQSSRTSITRETPYVSDGSATTAPPPRGTYHVTGIPVSDYLNVRDGAGSDYQVVTKLEPGASGILLGTKRIARGATTWQEITVDGQTGWVNAAYIAPETQAPTSSTESSIAP